MKPANELLKDFFSDKPAVRLGSGQTFLRPGDEITKVSYLSQGCISQYDISKSGDTVIVNSHTLGAIFPIASATDNKTVSFFYEAATPSLIKQVPLVRFTEFLESNPSVARFLLRKSNQEMNSLLRKMVYMMGGTATDRLVHELISASINQGDINSEGEVFIALSQNDLSKRTGLARETVNRSIQDLKQKGIIEPSRQGVNIPSFKDLEELLNQL